MKQNANAVTLEYVNRWGDHHTLALYRDSYAMGGGFAISALDATDPADSEYLSSCTNPNRRKATCSTATS